MFCRATSLMTNRSRAQGEAEILEHTREDGGLALKLDLPKRLQDHVCISCKIGDGAEAKLTFAEDDATAAAAVADNPGWDVQLANAQRSLFAQELFTSLAHGAHASAYASAPVDQNRVDMQLAGGPKLSVALHSIEVLWHPHPRPQARAPAPPAYCGCEPRAHRWTAHCALGSCWCGAMSFTFSLGARSFATPTTTTM